MIYLAADHGGFELKKHIKKHLTLEGFDFEDVGAHEFDANDDYPDYAIDAANKVSENPDENKAILMCRSGVGEAIVANKLKGVRATLSWDVKHAKMSREHNDTNVLALPADYISKEQAEQIINTWLDTKFSNEERHERRLRKILEVEK